MILCWDLITVFLVSLLTIYDVRSFGVWTKYQKKLDLLNKVFYQDCHWKFIFGQGVYISLDRTYYKNIIENELLAGALVILKDGEEQKNRGLFCPAGDPIRPELFLTNLFQKRHVIGSLLDMGLQVLQKSLRCMAYKDFIHMMTLVRNEITRKLVQNRSIKWSKAVRVLAVDVLILMDTLQCTDDQLLGIIKFLGFFNREQPEQSLRKFRVAAYLDSLIKEMLDYLPCNCIKAPRSAEEVAKELNVAVLTDLYDPSLSKNISEENYKKLFISATEKIKEHYGYIKLDVSMKKECWYEILQITTKQGDKDFIQIMT